MLKKQRATHFLKLLFVTTLICLFYPITAKAQSANLSEPYTVLNFDVDITIEKDTDLLVRENIKVLFNEKRHGIFRTIPQTYSPGFWTTSAPVRILSVVSNSGQRYKYETERQAQSIKLKIGDPDIYVTGEKQFVITYLVKNAIVRYEEHDEVYWNLLGSEWDTTIVNSSAKVFSEHAKIEKATCFAGRIGTREKNCTENIQDNFAEFNSDGSFGNGKDFTIVLALSKESELLFLSSTQAKVFDFFANWGYLPAVLPVVAMMGLWYFKGRDKRYLTDNIYYKPDDLKERTVSLFERRHIPLVYHPLDGVTPSELGTIIDEKVDIHDVVAEILELARLGFVKITKIEKKGILKNSVDYAFIKDTKYNDTSAFSALFDYQQYLLKEIFRSSIILRSVKKADTLFKGSSGQLDAVYKMLVKKEYVLLSAMRYHFYEGLGVFKNKLYKRMEEQGIFAANPETVRMTYISIFVVMEIAAGISSGFFFVSTYNFGPLILQGLGIVPGIVFAISMPRRTAYGYSLLRQALGLRWYLKKGKWRHDIAEKRLFIEEILPLAVTLGVVTSLANDMKELNIPPPNYFSGSSLAGFSRDFSSFKTQSTSAMLSTHSTSGRSSWSGGSGFSGGGSSGGGFGGGGGGSW